MEISVGSWSLANYNPDFVLIKIFNRYISHKRPDIFARIFPFSVTKTQIT